MFSKGYRALFTLPIIAVTLVLQACSGGDSNKNPEKSDGNVSISGTVTGLADIIVVSLNGNEETLQTNGDFTFVTRIPVNQDYSVQLVQQPTGLNCVINNGSGNAISNVSNIEISCTGIQGTAYSLNPLAFNEASKSILTFAFHIVDRFTGKAVEALTTDNVRDYLTITENELAISPLESFLEIEQLVGIDAQYTTAFAIDISSSMTANDLQQITTSIKNTISDENGNSLLQANQRVSIFTFDSAVENIVTSSQSLDTIFTALDNIKVGGNSTNLFGAIAASADSWVNEVSLSLVSYGSLILFTDGNDTSDMVSQETARASIGNKDVYFITIGSESNTSVLENFTDSSNIFSISDFNELGAVLDSTLQFAKSYENGLYLLSYATPKRAGNHKLGVTANDNYDCNSPVNDSETQQVSDTGFITHCVDSVTYDFNADGYVDVVPTVELSGIRATVSPTVTWEAKVRWSNAEPALQWEVEDCVGSIDYDISRNGKLVTFTRPSDSFNMVQVTVTDNKTLATQDGYLKMSNDESDFEFIKNRRDEDLCNQ